MQLDLRCRKHFNNKILAKMVDHVGGSDGHPELHPMASEAIDLLIISNGQLIASHKMLSIHVLLFLTADETFFIMLVVGNLSTLK